MAAAFRGALLFAALVVCAAVWPASALAGEPAAEEILRRAVEYRESIQSGRALEDEGRRPRGRQRVVTARGAEARRLRFLTVTREEAI